MRFHTYAKFRPESADAVDLQSLLDKLADFLLQSGFAGGGNPDPWGLSDADHSGDRSLDALRQAILEALISSGQFTPEMLEALRGDGDEISEAKLSTLLDEIVQRLIAEGFLTAKPTGEGKADPRSVLGPGGLAQAAAQQVQFDLTGKGIDFLGYKALYPRKSIPLPVRSNCTCCAAACASPPGPSTERGSAFPSPVGLAVRNPSAINRWTISSNRVESFASEISSPSPRSASSISGVNCPLEISASRIACRSASRERSPEWSASESPQGSGFPPPANPDWRRKSANLSRRDWRSTASADSGRNLA